MFNSLTSYLNIDELKNKPNSNKFDAIVHFAAIPRILLKSDEETFRVNVMGTYNLLESCLEYWNYLDSEKKKKYRHQKIQIFWNSKML